MSKQMQAKWDGRNKKNKRNKRIRNEKSNQDTLIISCSEPDDSVKRFISF